MTRPYMSERWFGLLALAVADHPRGKAGVADKLSASGVQVSRPQISLVMNGAYKASTRHLAAKVLATFDRHACPYLGTEIATDHCREVNSGPTPTWDPAALDMRRACQICPHAPGAFPQSSDAASSEHKPEVNQ